MRIEPDTTYLNVVLKNTYDDGKIKMEIFVNAGFLAFLSFFLIKRGVVENDV